MNHFLVKTEPNTYSWERLQKEKKCVWDGVRSYPGRLHLRAMEKGDQVLVYHSGDDKKVCGIATVLKAGYPDPTAEGEDWTAVDLAPVSQLKNEVSLSMIKQTALLKNIALIKQSRLSVMPLSKAEFDCIVQLGS